MKPLPVYEPNLHGNEQRYVLDCLTSSWISSKGKYVEQFESGMAHFTGSRYAIAVTNGTVALHVALLALGVGPGDEVIVPTFTYIASVNAIAYTGAKPIFADSRTDTWQLDPDDLSRRISERTKAIMCVHLYGHPCELRSLRQIADKHRIFLVEDCAEALGSAYEGAHVGNFGDVATYSFYGNKTLTTGEGGMVTSNDATIAERVTHFKGQGLAKYREYWHDVVGYNYRMTNICAAIGVAQLERIEAILARKRVIAELYKHALADTEYEVHAEATNVRHSYWMVTLLVKDPSRRDETRSYLARQGIETRPAFYPVHTMPMYSQRYERHRVAEDLASRGINLPSYPDLSDGDVERVCAALRDCA